VRETEAEAVAFVVCCAIGLDANTASSDYIQLHSGDKTTLAESLSVIQKSGRQNSHWRPAARRRRSLKWRRSSRCGYCSTTESMGTAIWHDQHRERLLNSMTLLAP